MDPFVRGTVPVYLSTADTGPIVGKPSWYYWPVLGVHERGWCTSSGIRPLVGQAVHSRLRVPIGGSMGRILGSQGVSDGSLGLRVSQMDPWVS